MGWGVYIGDGAVDDVFLWKPGRADGLRTPELRHVRSRFIMLRLCFSCAKSAKAKQRNPAGRTVVVSMYALQTP
jgi:hypothetical protein